MAKPIKPTRVSFKLSCLTILFLFLVLTPVGQVGLARADEVDQVQITSALANAVVAITLDADKPHQVMQGFGALTLPLVYSKDGDVLGIELRRQAIDILSQQVRLNLNILEGGVLETPGGYEKRANDDANPFHINPAGFEVERARAIKTRFLDLLPKPDLTRYLLLQRINIRWDSPWLGELRKNDYPRFLDEAAEQILSGALYWRDSLGYTPEFLFPFNEPFSGNTELGIQDSKQLADIIKRAGARLEAAGFKNIKMVVPNEETVQMTVSSASAILNDLQARKYVAAIGYHPYPYGSVYANIPLLLATSGSGKPDKAAIQQRQELRRLSQKYNIPLWMTEISTGGVEPLSYDAFLGRAIHIHDELTYADAAAYFAMHSMWDSISHQMHFGSADLFAARSEGNILLIDVEKKKVFITGMGYAIGHYARWLKPGAVRIEAASSDPLVQVSAFYHANLGQLTLVLINNAAQERSINFTINGLKPSGIISAEQSTKAEYWKALPGLAIQQGVAIKISLPPKSVTSLALKASR